MGKFDRPDPSLDASNVTATINGMHTNGWSGVNVQFDIDLRIWRADGIKNGMKREGRGSTKVLALAALNAIK